jgi:hypothetical protein
MPELQEVFRLATQKVRPDPGFEDRQYDYRRKKERNRKIGVFAFVAGMGAVAAVLVLRSVAERQSQPADQPAPTPTSAGRIYTGSTTVDGVTTLTVEGVTFSFREPPVGEGCVPNRWTCGEWERHGAAQPFLSESEWDAYPHPASVNRSVWGAQGAEAIVFFTGFPDGEYADPCANLLTSPPSQSAADLTATVAAAPGTELVTGPSDVTVGGRPAKHVVLTVREDLGCDPGFFYTWKAGQGGALWPTTDEGATIRVWIVDVDGTLLFIEAETVRELEEWRTPLKDHLEREINQIVDSIRFD